MSIFSMPTNPRFQDLTDQEFHRLTVMSYQGKRGKDHYWECWCQDGNVVVVSSSSLKRGDTKSCGCWRLGRYTKHGYCKEKKGKEYQAWVRIKGRCYNKNNHKFHRYGGRGITVCERWLNSFEAFLADMGLAPAAKYSVGRIDNDGDYEPSNCRWETNHQQQRNRSDNVILTIDGESRCISEWSEISGVKHITIRQRKNKGWSDKDSVFTPPEIYS